ncbi:MAG: 16S rRNA processing protein RimM [Deltaproteobacteria bacterium]|nr:16S rRNA processing protein RimM [Deltaproteobacteria bacterium]
MSQAGAPHYVPVAAVGRPHGLRGELRVMLYNPDSDVLFARRVLRLVPRQGEPRLVELRAARRGSRGAWLVRLPGVDSIETAQELQGAVIEVARAELGPLGEDEYYFCDLEGCRAILAGAELGVVARLIAYPSCDVLVIERPEGPAIEVPLHRDFIARVDVSARTIELRTIEGL